MPETLIIYSDGGARGNPGPAAIGFVIYNEDSHILKNVGMFIGTATNNQAEYRALIEALKAAIDLQAKQVFCFLDSELVVKQATGRYKVRQPELKNLVAEVLKLSNKFLKIHFKHTPREKNKLADKLVNKALDEAGF